VHQTLRPTRRALFAAPVLLVCGPAGAAPSGDDVAAARARCTRIAGGFFERLAALKLDDKGAPGIEIAYTPARTAYDPTRRVITAPAWSQAPASLRAQVETWARASGGRLSAPELFGEIYNGFMIAHEATHAYQSDLGFWRPETDQYESETVANRGAIAFALESPEGTRHVTQLIELAAAALEATPSPVPEGAKAGAYFNANADAIRADPAQHAWFEAHLLLRAWDKREEMDFVTMMRRLKLAAQP
jgi:hypothetical protein